MTKRSDLITQDHFPCILNSIACLSSRNILFNKPNAKAGFTFTTPYLYNSVGFAGRPDYVKCADAKDSTNGVCSKLTVCALASTTHSDNVKTLFPNRVELVPSLRDMYSAFVNGVCTVITGEQFDVSKFAFEQSGFIAGNYSIGNTVVSKESIGLVTRDGDVPWSDFVNWILIALLKAEEDGIVLVDLLEQRVDFFAGFYLEFDHIVPLIVFVHDV